MGFVHLHNHTHYSLLDGLAKIDELVELAKSEGAKALAITDHGVMYGVIEFYKKCKKEGIKPIIGVEAYLAPGSRFDKSKSDEKLYYHLLLLVKNEQGYKNLIKLTTIGHLEGFYYKPRIDWEVLQKHAEGLIASTACLGGEIPRLILSGKEEKARKRIKDYNNLFGQDNFYLEIMPHRNLPGQWELNKKLIQLSEELNVPLAATNDNHYLNKDDDMAQDILLCLQNKKKLEDADRMNMTGIDYSVKGEEDMKEAFLDLPGAEQAIANTEKIAEMCNLDIKLGEIKLPFFKVPHGFSDMQYLEHLCKEGVKNRYGHGFDEASEEIRERMNYEISVIGKMGWPAYFLIVADFVNWSKDNGIIVGPGRGSAAGSLICYLLGITDLDPLKYGLLFERFLNPDRVSMPDIDLDFADARRDEVIRYVESKYGQDHVAQIITFGTMAARAAVRDVGRVLGVPYDYCDKLAKMIPMFTDLKSALGNVQELRDIYSSDETAKKVLDFAKKLEGVARHASTHACGVLITKDPLTEYVPLQYASSSDQSIVSQYSLHPVEDLGLLKMDFLGLKNLTIIESAIKIIKNTRGINIDISQIPLDDQKAYELFQKGETTGVFQFESSGMKRYLKELQPTEFEDIIAMVALYRPGPMEWIPDFIAGKHGKKKPTYLHEKLEPILRKTYGVAIYQEQVMQMARDLAGFSMAEADVLRKAVGKKIAELLGEQKTKFIEGCVKNGINSSLAEQIFLFIEPFAGYGFNRSHAACYALIGYQTAYLKAHWPTEFMAALLTADQQNTDRVAIEIEECRKMGIEVKQPDINQSFDSFTVVTSGTEKNETVSQSERVNIIRFGLNAIKNVGEHIVDVIIEERKSGGPYKDISDFMERIMDKDLNKKSVESLIKGGAMDNFGERGMLVSNIENMLKFNREISEQRKSRQNSLFGEAILGEHKVKLENFAPVDRQLKLAWERELLGLYITEHPFGDYKKSLSEYIKTARIRELPSCLAEDKVNIAGIITSIKKIITRSNDPMLFVKIEDDSDSTEVLVFPKLLKETGDIWTEGSAVIVQGAVSDKDGEIKVLANTAHNITLENMRQDADQFKVKVTSLPQKSFYRRKNGNTVRREQPATPPAPSSNPLKLIFKNSAGEDVFSRLKDLLAAHPGSDPVFFKISTNGSADIIKTSFKVNSNENLKKGIKDNFSGHIEVVD